MNDGGVDLHEKVVTACVLDADRKLARGAKPHPSEPHRVVDFVEGPGERQVVLEATSDRHRSVEPPGHSGRALIRRQAERV